MGDSGTAELIVTEASSPTIQEFWQEHPMLAALVSSALVIALTLLIIDEAVAAGSRSSPDSVPGCRQRPGDLARFCNAAAGPRVVGVSTAG
jgi:hypothetical protein